MTTPPSQPWCRFTLGLPLLPNTWKVHRSISLSRHFETLWLRVALHVLFSGDFWYFCWTSRRINLHNVASVLLCPLSILWLCYFERKSLVFLLLIDNIYLQSLTALFDIRFYRPVFICSFWFRSLLCAKRLEQNFQHTVVSVFHLADEWADLKIPHHSWIQHGLTHSPTQCGSYIMATMKFLYRLSESNVFLAIN